MLTYCFNLIVKPASECSNINLKALSDKLRENWTDDMPTLMACKLSADNVEFIAPSFKMPLTATEFEDSLKKFFPREVGEPVCINNFREIKFKNFCWILCSAEAAGVGWIGYKNILEYFFHGEMQKTVCGISRNKFFKFDEFFPQVEFKTKQDLLTYAEKILPHKSLIDELNRIFDAPSTSEHYIIKARSRESAKDIVSVLVAALYANNHLISRRVGWFSDMFAPFGAYFQNLIQYLSSTALVFELPKVSTHWNVPESSKSPTLQAHLSESIIETILTDPNFSRKTLFIFVDIVGDNESTSDAVADAFDEILYFKKICEGKGGTASAKKYLKYLLEKSNQKVVNDEEEKNFLTHNEICSAADVVKISQLIIKNRLYPAYKNFFAV